MAVKIDSQHEKSVQDLLEKLEKIDKLQGKIGTSAIGGGSTSVASGGTDTKKVDDIKSDTEQILAKVEFMRSRLHTYSVKTETETFKFEKIQNWSENIDTLLRDLLKSVHLPRLTSPEGQENLKRSMIDILNSLAVDIAAGKWGPEQKQNYAQFSRITSTDLPQYATDIADYFLLSSFGGELKSEKQHLSGSPKSLTNFALDLGKYGFEAGSKFILGEQTSTEYIQVEKIREIYKKFMAHTRWAGTDIAELPEPSGGWRDLTEDEIRQNIIDLIGPAAGGRDPKSRSENLLKLLQEVKGTEAIPFEKIGKFRKTFLELMIPESIGGTGVVGTGIKGSGMLGGINYPDDLLKDLPGFIPGTTITKGVFEKFLAELIPGKAVELKVPDVYNIFTKELSKNFQEIAAEVLHSRGTDVFDKFITKFEIALMSELPVATAKDYAETYRIVMQTILESISKHKPKEMPDEEAYKLFADILTHPGYGAYKEKIGKTTLKDEATLRGLEHYKAQLRFGLGKLVIDDLYQTGLDWDVPARQYMPVPKQLSVGEFEALSQEARVSWSKETYTNLLEGLRSIMVSSLEPEKGQKEALINALETFAEQLKDNTKKIDEVKDEES